MSQQQRPREPYEAPRVRKITLAADEMAAAKCKTVQAGKEVCKRGSVFVTKTIGS